jgi:aspartate carbamoyltransferase catalytic subunit
MDSVKIKNLISDLAKLSYQGMFNQDFLLTWDKSNDEIAATFKVAEILRGLRQQGISSRIFDSGLGISIFRDNSTRTRFSFASACNLLGLTVQDLDEGKSQIAHGETVRETANMVSFMADVIGIRDDMYIGKGNAYMREVSQAVQQGHAEGVSGTAPHPGQPAVRHRPPHPDHGRHGPSDSSTSAGLKTSRAKSWP